MVSRVKGVPGVRRLLKRLPDEVAADIARELERAGREIVPVMRGRAPFRTGATVAGISYRVLPKALKLLVGLISTPLGRAKLFYARIQDLGRKPQVVTVTRFRPGGRVAGGGSKASRGPVSTYSMNVRGMPGKHFITGSFRTLRQRLTTNLRAIWDRAIGRAAAGGGTD